MAYLEIKNFTKSFGNTEVLNGIDIQVEKGKAISIIGPSGSGKSTLLRCINFLENPDTGVMVLDGETLLDCSKQEKLNDNQLREKRLNFGLVFQSFNLFPQHNVLKNITLAPTLLLKEKIKAYQKELKADKTISRKARKTLINNFKKEQKEIIENNALELLKKTGLEDKKDAYPCELSGGQSQRVAIARALALNPKILCFDEPTSALDPELTGEVLKVIRSLADEKHTIIIVTHEMGFAKNVSDKVVFLYNGKVVEYGDAKQVLENPSTPELKNFLANVSEKE